MFSRRTSSSSSTGVMWTMKPELADSSAGSPSTSLEASVLIKENLDGYCPSFDVVTAAGCHDALVA